MKEKLAYWINERDKIRRRKEAGDEKPWSVDPTFQTTYFCNVHREDDRVTKWIKENWRPHFPHPNYEIAVILSRMINWPDSLEVLGFPENWDKDRLLKTFQSIEGKKWGNAYVITTHGMKMPKDVYVFSLVDAIKEFSKDIRNCQTCMEAYNFLQVFDGLGSFLAAQVVADLKNTKGHPLEIASDRTYFCAPGPGSLRGLSWYHNEKITNRYFHTAIDVAYEETMPLVNSDIKPIDMQDFQNCLCEFDKYMRVSTGAGRSKRRYPGT